MAREIQIGDKVRCIEPNNSNGLILNKIYIVTDIDFNTFLIKGFTCWFYKYRFELVEDCKLIEIF